MISVCAVLLCLGDLTSFHIGNSLTFNARPDKLPHDIGIHYNWNQDLGYIQANADAPNGFTPGLGGYRNALTVADWDYVTVQPFVGSDLATDIGFFEEVKQLAPNSQIIVYESWPSIANSSFADAWSEPVIGSNPATNQTAAYFNLLSNELNARGISHRRAPVGAALNAIDIAARAGEIPGLAKVEDLYTDNVHVSHDGWFVAHTTLHASIYGELPLSVHSVIGPTLTDSLRESLGLQVLEVVVVPEPGAWLLVSVVCLGAIATRFVRRGTRRGRLTAN